MVRKLQWEAFRLKCLFGTKECEYAAINVAWTAHHAIDWIAAEITERGLWEDVVKKFGLNIDLKVVGEKKKLKALQEYAAAASPAMFALEQWSLAAKHRNLSEFEPAVSTLTEDAHMMGAEYGPGVVVTLPIQYSQVRGPDAEDGTPQYFMQMTYSVATAALSWLYQFIDDCGVVGAYEKP